jgi:opacity protein-like surface antigen
MYRIILLGLLFLSLPSASLPALAHAADPKTVAVRAATQRLMGIEGVEVSLEKPASVHAMRLSTESARDTLNLGNRKVVLFFSSGMSLPTSPRIFKEGWNSGLNMGGGIGYRVAPYCAVVSEVEYSRFILNENWVRQQVASGMGGLDFGMTTNGGTGTMVSVSGALKLFPIPAANPVSPYVVGGIGYSRASVSDFTGLLVIAVSDVAFEIPATAAGASKSAVTVLLGGGLDIAMSRRIGLFLEGRYGIIFLPNSTLTIDMHFSSGTQHIPLQTEGDHLRYFPIKIGFRVAL